MTVAEIRTLLARANAGDRCRRGSSPTISVLDRVLEHTRADGVPLRLDTTNPARPGREG